MKVRTGSTGVIKAGKIDSFFLIFGSVWFIAGLPFVFAGYYMLKTESLYEDSAVKTQGTLDSKFISETRNSKNNTSSKSYKVRYRFTNEQGLEVSGEDSLDQEVWNKLKENERIDLEFIPGQSGDKNRALGSSQAGGIAGYFFIGMGLISEILGLAFIIPYFKKRAKHKRISRNGVLIEGEITGVGKGSLTINNVTQWRIKYTYKDTTGKTHEGQTEHLPPHIAEPWDRGDKCKIRYDKNNPESSIFVGK